MTDRYLTSLEMELVVAASDYLQAVRNFTALRLNGNTKAAQIARQRVQRLDYKLQDVIDRASNTEFVEGSE